MKFFDSNGIVINKKDFGEADRYITIFTESTLKTSFYEELQKNEWCNVISDKPDNLVELITIKIKKSIKI